MRYGVVFVAAGVGRVINGGERGEGRRADATDRFLADLRTSAANIFVQRSRTLQSEKERMAFYSVLARVRTLYCNNYITNYITKAGVIIIVLSFIIRVSVFPSA